MPDNDDVASVIAAQNAGDPQYYGSFFGEDSDSRVSPLHAVGQIDTAGDKDVYVIDFQDPATMLQYSFFCQMRQNLSPNIELL